MLRMLIVDDEYVIREGLRDCVDWESMDIEVVGEAENGKEALLKVKSLKPDIVITDIVMPGMDGISFIEKLRKDTENIYVILISAHQDIQYLKAALKLEAIDYILKPFSIDELQQVIEKVKRKFLNEKEKKDRITDIKNRFRESLPILRQRFFESLITGDISNDTDFGKQLNNLEMDIDQEDIRVFLTTKKIFYKTLTIKKIWNIKTSQVHHCW